MLKIQNPDEIEQVGSLILIYGKTWSGKTWSTLESLAKVGKTLFVGAEPRGDNAKIMKAIKFNSSKGDYAAYDSEASINDVLETFNSKEECDKYKCIFFDGLSYVMGFTLQSEVTTQDHNSRSNKKDIGTKLLASQTKMSVESHGIINNLVKRLLSALGNRAKDGKIVVVSALDDTMFKFGDKYIGGPALTGKEVPRLLPPLFDYIGYVETRTEVDDNGNVVMNKHGNPKIAYPPVVFWESAGSREFVAKGGGIGLLDFNRMFGKKN